MVEVMQSKFGHSFGPVSVEQRIRLAGLMAAQHESLSSGGVTLDDLLT